MKRRPKILVVGSLVMDFIVTGPRFPNRGETVVGTDYRTAPGGKGANQAYQAALLGAEVTMVGCVGDDAYGKTLCNALQAVGVDVAHVRKTANARTALGNVQIETGGGKKDNRILVIPGANLELSPADIAFLEREIHSFDMLLLQNEIPQEVNLLAAQLAKSAGVPVLLNPAPYSPISAELLSCLSCIAPNEHEARDMTQLKITDEASARYACNRLLGMGVKEAMITCGSKGAYYADGAQFLHSPCIPCETVVDPTAAGDSFLGAYAAARCFGATAQQALRLANCTAHLTVSAMGAMPSLPASSAVFALMRACGEKLDAWEGMM